MLQSLLSASIQFSFNHKKRLLHRTSIGGSLPCNRTGRELRMSATGDRVIRCLSVCLSVAKGVRSTEWSAHSLIEALLIRVANIVS